MAFAQGNRVRHLLSGGYFIPAHILGASLEKASTSPRPEMLVVTNWRTVGPGPLNLIRADQTVQSYLGLLGAGQQAMSPGICSPAVKTSHADAVAIGRCKADKERPRPFNQTLTGQKLPGVVDSSVNQLYVTGTEVYLLNGDKCVVGQHVIVQPSHLNSPTFIACLREIIQQVGSPNHDNSKPDGLLLETVDSSRTSTKFRMPLLQNVNEWSFVPISVSSGLLLCQEPFVKYFSRTYYAPSILSTIATPTNVQPVGFVIFIKNVCGPSVEHRLCSISPTQMTSFSIPPKCVMLCISRNSANEIILT